MLDEGRVDRVRGGGEWNQKLSLKLELQVRWLETYCVIGEGMVLKEESQNIEGWHRIGTKYSDWAEPAFRPYPKKLGDADWRWDLRQLNENRSRSIGSTPLFGKVEHS